MTRSIGRATLLVLLALAGSARGDVDPLRPPLDYAYNDRPPRALVAAERPNQIRLSYLPRAGVFSRRDNQKLGEIATVFIDPAAGLASTVELARSRALIAWGSLELQPRPKPAFLVDLEPEDIANAPRPEQASGVEDMPTIIGRDAVGADGRKLGTVTDLIATLGDGTLVAVAIEENAFLRPKEVRAVAWQAIQGRSERGELRLAVGSADFAKAPLLVTMAPRWAEHDPAASGNTQPRAVPR